MKHADPADPQYAMMIGRPVPGLVVSLAIPTIISMMIASVYNMADTWFVSKLGTSASGAVGIVFSLMTIIQATGFTLGLGSGVWISLLLGSNKKDEASSVAASGLYAAVVLGCITAVAGLLFIDPLMQILGATKTILPYARDYARYILFAAPVFTASMVLSSILRAEGKARFSMIGIMVGGILNCGLDPLFIFTFGMGVGGAAIATALSQLVSLCILLVPFILGRTVTRLGIRRASVRVATYRRIITLGLPSFLRQSLATVATMALNLSAAAFGDTAVAAMSIVGRLVMFVFSITIGFAQGYQPVLGYNYGAGQILRVRQAFAFTFKVCLGIMTAGGLGGFFAAPWLMRLFIARDPEVVRIGTLALRAQCIAMPFVPMGIMANMTYQSIGKSWTATFLSAARQGIFFLPLILLLPPLLGLTGVQITQALADFATFWLCIPFVLRFYRTLGQNSSGGSELRAVPSAHKEQGFDTQG